MGLIRPNGNYIRLDTQGKYWIYQSKEDRFIEKSSLSPEAIKQKYLEIIGELEADDEGLYYLGTTQILNNWITEFYSYLDKDTSKGFPLLQEQVPDVANTVTKFVGTGVIGVNGSTLAEIYLDVKTRKIFGETEDDLE